MTNDANSPGEGIYCGRIRGCRIHAMFYLESFVWLYYFIYVYCSWVLFYCVWGALSYLILP